MLLFSRKFDESVTATVPASKSPTRILITYRGLDHRKEAMIGFDAPRAVAINRTEVQQEIDRDGERRSEAHPPDDCTIRELLKRFPRGFIVAENGTVSPT